MSDKRLEEEGPPGEAAPEILDGRIWIDGCWDFFHFG
jgi:ethanolamine-phosphate cytidylyltransferase